MGKMERSTVRRRVKSPSLSVASSGNPTLAPEYSVLVVESDPDLQAQMASVLRKQGLRVVATGSGSGALALVRQWRASLILVSESLPGRSGIDLVREILRTRPDLHVVMVTAHVEPRFAAAARAAGALGCVVKPLGAESLIPWLKDSAAAESRVAQGSSHETQRAARRRSSPDASGPVPLTRHAAFGSRVDPPASTSLATANRALRSRGAVAE